MQAKQFTYLDYRVDVEGRRVVMRYQQDDRVFTDEVAFEFELAKDINVELADRAARSLWLMNGISYYKSGMAPTIDATAAHLTAAEAAFFSQTFRLGLGQLCYENGLSLEAVATFVADEAAEAHPVAAVSLQGSLVGLGGGKDSLVSTTILDTMGQEYATFSATYLPESNPALQRLAEEIGHPHLTIRRRFDPQLGELNRAGAINGHVPVTAIIMLIGLTAAILTGRRQVIMSNEASAGEGNVEYQGTEINHQYSKSLDYERAFNEYIVANISPDVAVFSLLRPLGELQIAKLFSQGVMQKYAGLYSSCNRNFRHDATVFSWCGECSKCAFVFLILSPFVPKAELIQVVGSNVLAKPELDETFRGLLGLSGHKPFECVGEIEECRAAATLARATGNYPELDRFDVPATTADLRQLGSDVMPQEYHTVVQEAVSQL